MIEHSEQTDSSAKITPLKKTLDIYPSLADLEKAIKWDHTETVKVADNSLQISINSVFTTNQGPVPNPVANVPSQQATATHWLPQQLPAIHHLHAMIPQL